MKTLHMGTTKRSEPAQLLYGPIAPVPLVGDGAGEDEHAIVLPAILQRNAFNVRIHVGMGGHFDEGGFGFGG